MQKKKLILSIITEYHLPLLAYFIEIDNQLSSIIFPIYWFHFCVRYVINIYLFYKRYITIEKERNHRRHNIANCESEKRIRNAGGTPSMVWQYFAQLDVSSTKLPPQRHGSFQQCVPAGIVVTEETIDAATIAINPNRPAWGLDPGRVSPRGKSMV